MAAMKSAPKNWVRRRAYTCCQDRRKAANQDLPRGRRAPAADRRTGALMREWKRPTPTKSRSLCSAPCLERWPSASSATPSSRPKRPRSRATRCPAAEAAAAPAAAAPAAPEVPLPALLAKADAAKGQNDVKVCEACHSFDKGGPAKVGPPLWGVVGRPVASVAGFAYSDALKAVGGDWTYEKLNIGSPSRRLAARAPRWPSPAKPKPASAPTFSPTCRSSRTARFRSRNKRTDPRGAGVTAVRGFRTRPAVRRCRAASARSAAA